MTSADPRPPTRADLAKIFKDQRLIKAFERIFELIPTELTTITTLIETVTVAADFSGSKGQQAVDEVARMATALEMLTVAPKSECPVLDFPEKDILQPTINQSSLIDSDYTINGDLILPKVAGKGIKIDKVAPTFGWRDMLGEVNPRSTGVGRPTLSAFRGGLVREFAFAENDDQDVAFHLPHDYVPGTDLYFHVHWGHNGTAISGNIVWDINFTYTKGHDQSIFPAEKNITITYATTDIATTPQYQHRIEEVQMSTPGGSGTLLDSDLIEPDGVILLHFDQTTIPTITGGSPNQPFVFFIDVHYQSTNIATKQRVPDFYV
jgi:hypothetical protein